MWFFFLATQTNQRFHDLRFWLDSAWKSVQPGAKYRKPSRYNNRVQTVYLFVVADGFPSRDGFGFGLVHHTRRTVDNYTGRGGGFLCQNSKVWTMEVCKESAHFKSESLSNSSQFGFLWNGIGIFSGDWTTCFFLLLLSAPLFELWQVNCSSEHTQRAQDFLELFFLLLFFGRMLQSLSFPEVVWVFPKWVF